MTEWIDLDELLDKDIGDIREMLAHEDSDTSFRTFLIENGWIIDEDDEYDDNYDEDYEEEDDEFIELPSDEEQMAQEVADDILKNKYTVANLDGVYPTRFIQRVAQILKELGF